MKFINLKYPRSRNSQGGSIIIYTILILLVVITIAIALMRLILPKFKIVRESVYSVVALYATDTGAEWCLFMFNKFASPPVDPSTILAYSFDEGSGSVANDMSAANNDGSIVAATWASGKFDGGLSFDGISSRVTPSNPNIVEGLGNFTVVAWARSDITTTIAGRGIVSQNRGAGGDSFNLLLANEDRIRFTVETVNGIGSVDANNFLADTNWHHYAGVYNGSFVLLYVDGVLQNEQMATTGNVITSTNPVDIGTYDSSRYWDGGIDEVRIYNRALSAAEIQAMIPPPPPVMSNGATISIYSPATTNNSSSCTESVMDHRIVGLYRDISRSLELFE